MTEPVLRFENLGVLYRTPGAAGTRAVHALRGFTLQVTRGSRVGIVGESGSGKTTLGLALLRLLPRSAVCSGSLTLLPRDECCGRAVDVPVLSGKALRHFRGRHASMVFQDPFGAMDPVLRIGRQIVSAIACHRTLRDGAEARAFAERLLERVHLGDPAVVLRKYPHQLSGGQLQRVCIALALAHNPDVVVADEPTTALDAHLREGILSLLDEAAASGSSILLITHDISVVGSHTDRTCILYAGELVEAGPTADITADPLHPYTRLLIAARPTAQQRGAPLTVIPGNLPDLSDTAVFSRCIFLPRCPDRLPVCGRSGPPPVFTRDDRTVRCYRYGGGCGD